LIAYPLFRFELLAPPKNYKFLPFCLLHQRSQTQIVSKINE
jgi:hypothetical protein